MCFIERETQNCILKFREIFPWKEPALMSAEWNLMKSHFSVKYMQFFWEKLLHVAIDRYFSLFLKGFEGFPQPKVITDSPFKVHSTIHKVYDIQDAPFNMYV